MVSEGQQLKEKKKRKTRKQVPVIMVPVICAVIGAVGVIIGAEISKSSPSPSESVPVLSPTPPPLGTGTYTISSSALGYLDVPDPNGSGLVEYDCQTLPTGTSGSSFELCFDELDVIVSDLGGGFNNSRNQVWNIQEANSGVDYAIQSTYNGSVLTGLSLDPPSCNHFASYTNVHGISYGYLIVTSACTTALPDYLTDTFDIVPVAGGYEVRNNDGLCLTAVNGAGGNGTSTHTRFEQCASSIADYQVWSMNPAA
jgi:hypothetical protein